MILHVMMDEKFTVPFITFVNQHFDNSQNVFLIMCSGTQMRFARMAENVNNAFVAHKNIGGLYQIVSHMRSADKIILHGMFTPYIVYLMDLLNLAPKTYWYIWGGDLYDYKTDSPRWKKVKSRVISNLKGIISPLEGDYLLAREAYGARCKCLSALLPNTTITDTHQALDFEAKTLRNHTCNILLGNSADCENKHMYVLDELKAFADEDIHIYMPLSYGDQEYAHKVAQYARDIYGDKVTPMFDFMPLEQYKTFLAGIHVAIFAHERQQAFSNIIQLVSLGTKIYLNGTVSSWKFLNDLGVHVFDVKDVRENLLEPLTLEQLCNNRKYICRRCSMASLIGEWKTVFDD